jgi:hypothetical protein
VAIFCMHSRSVNIGMRLELLVPAELVPELDGRRHPTCRERGRSHRVGARRKATAGRDFLYAIIKLMKQWARFSQAGPLACLSAGLFLG